MPISSGVPAKVEFRPEVPSSYNLDGSYKVITQSNLEITNITEIAQFSGLRVTGDVINSSTLSADLCQVFFIYKDEAGNILGGYDWYVSSLSANATTAFDATLYDTPTGFDSYAIYVSAASSK